MEKEARVTPYHFITALPPTLYNRVAKCATWNLALPCSAPYVPNSGNALRADPGQVGGLLWGDLGRRGATWGEEEVRSDCWDAV